MRNNLYLFFLVIGLFFLTIYLSTNILSSEQLVYDFYSELLTEEKAEELIESSKKWWWVSYALIFIIVLVRSSLVALCLSIGLLFYDMERDLGFKKIFNVALTGELILVLVGFFKIFYFVFFKENYSFQDIQEFSPLSYISFLDITKIEPWLIYPLQILNLFEVGYFFVLVYGLHRLLNNKYWKSFEIVALSYGTGLTIWVGIVMFLILNS